MSASMETPASGTGTPAPPLGKSPARFVNVESGIVGLVFRIGGGYQVQAAPFGEFVEPAGRWQADVSGDLELDAGSECQPAPDRALGRKQLVVVWAAGAPIRTSGRALLVR